MNTVNVFSRRYARRSARCVLSIASSVALVCSTHVVAYGATAPIVVGAIVSDTGASASLGIPEKNALELFEKEINARGGVDGRPLHFDIVDDGAKADVAAQLATQLIGRGAVAIICGTRVDTGTAVTRITTSAGMLQVALTPGIEIWKPRSAVVKTVFQTPAHDALEMQALLAYASRKLHAKRAAILHDENNYGTNITNVALAEAPQHGMTIVANEAYPGEATDFTAQWQKIKAANPDIVLLLGAATTPGLATRNARSLGIKTPILGSSGISSLGFLQIAGTAASSTYAVSSLDPEHPRVTEKHLADAYEAQYHQPLVSFAGFAYDAAGLVVRAIEIAKGKTDGASLVAALERMRGYAGVNGTYKFSAADHNGLTVRDVHVLIANRGTWSSAP